MRDDPFMQRAIQLALLLRQERNLPVGAVITLDGGVVAEGRSAIWVPDFDATRHAEIEALRAVPPDLWNLSDQMSLYTTLEPCLMCFASILLHKVGRVVFGSSDSYGGPVRFCPTCHRTSGREWRIPNGWDLLCPASVIRYVNDSGRWRKLEVNRSEVKLPGTPVTFTLPEEFMLRVISTWGEAGREWLDRLPTIITMCAERWKLTVQSLVSDLSYNFVAYVMIDDGRQAILKVGVPNPELATEIEALRMYQGRYAPKLLEADLNLGALVMQRLAPGTPLSALKDDEGATVIAAQLMRDLPVPEPPSHQFPTVERWALAFDRYRKRFDGRHGPLPNKMQKKAGGLFRDLQTSSPKVKLLHGDLHHDNILSNGEECWLAIDPKGVIADPAYEAARFQHNPIPRFLSQEKPQAVAERRSEILASILEVDRARLLAWGFFDVMLGALWCIEEDSDDWGYFLSCAELLDTLTN